jgi:hypothetical protein
MNAERARDASVEADRRLLRATIVGVNPSGAMGNCGYVVGAIDERLAGDLAAAPTPRPRIGG